MARPSRASVRERAIAPAIPLALGALAFALALGAPGAARAGGAPAPGDDFAARVIARARALLEEASAARVPPRRPPTPIKVTWKARRLGAVDLGGALLAMTSGDLDGDGRAELVAVTDAEVLVLAPQGRRAIAVVARAPLPAEPASLQPRDPVAAAAVARAVGGMELRVRASTAGRGARYRFDGKALTETGAQDLYPLCADREGALAPGRNHFARPEAGDALPATWPSTYLTAACRDDLVDREGRALRADAAVGAAGALHVTVRVRCGADEAGCVVERSLTIAGAGDAIAIADVDRDGRPEVIVSAAGAPGDPDTVTVHAVPAPGGKPGKPIFEKAFSGGVGGVAADDLDGDGDVEVIAAVRLAGAARVDLWLLD